MRTCGANANCYGPTGTSNANNGEAPSDIKAYASYSGSPNGCGNYNNGGGTSYFKANGGYDLMSY
jgi:hypothetical protein